MILLWGSPHDQPVAAVRDALQRRGAGYFLLDSDAALATDVELDVARQVTGHLRTPEGRIDISAISACYLRPGDARQLAPAGTDDERQAALDHALRIEDALLSWAELAEATILNRPSAMASNGSKPYQLRLIEAAGFQVPDTLVTTDPDAAMDFWKSHGDVIYKSVSGVRSIVSRLSAAHLSRLPDIGSCPTQFQRYIAGRDIRVHVVADAVFASEIVSAADDYRYASRQGASVEIFPCELPDEVAGRCMALARFLNLPLAGIDLRRGLDGGWYCFEVNPSPGFSYYENHTGQPIADAIAGLLADAAPAPTPAFSW